MKAEKRFFTLVELLGVMALISILATLGFSGYSYAMSSAKDKSARATVKRMEAGIEAMKTKQGFYPSTSGEFKPIIIELNTSDNTVKSLEFKGTKFEVPSESRMKDVKDGKKRLELKEKAVLAFLKVVELDTLVNSIDKSNGYLLDPWGNPIYYCYPAKIRSSGFDLISAGPDGLFSKDNADKPDNKKTNDFRDKDDGTPLCDDILND